LNEYKDRYRKFLESEGQEAASSREAQRDWSGKEYAQDYAQAAYSSIERPYMEAAQDLRGRQVGQGRTRTGFGFEDEDRFYRDAFAQPLAETIGMSSVQLAGMDAGMINARASSQDRFGDALAGGWDREQAEENAKKKKKKGLWSTLGMVAGAGIGSLIPGVGTYLGGAAGSALGGALA